MLVAFVLVAFILAVTKQSNGERPHDIFVILQVTQKKERFTYLVLF
ncbi:hypothetical protein KUC_1573 [Vreelandella boliviensis LC1]|uniref:Uncharacterized protein n=1 Tax=Vreelandella boliviensis LC1 TaxID=1072583 RepID=A0A7U9C5R4_9GAMM|nr:hypothetical protein KUC_1573 [Halomonas boliviensis LC1]